MENKIHLITRVHLFIQHAFIWQLPCDIWQIAVIFFPLILSTLFSILPSYHFSLAVN